MSDRRIPLDLRSLGGGQQIFRLSGAVRRDPAVDSWLADGPVELKAIAQEWFVQMRQCGDDVRELLHDGCPVACVEDAPFGYVNSFKSHVNVGAAALRGLIDAAYADIRARLGAGRSSRDGRIS